MSTDRLALARLSRDGEHLRLAHTGRAVVNLPEYSQFKYGDGLASWRYGSALADLVVPTLDPGTPVMVTSSGFGFVPPAAHSLVDHFVTRARALGRDVRPFRVWRSTVSNGDYASMTLEARQKAMSSHALTIDRGVRLDGATVVALDDVRVTGVHERAMDDCLRGAGAGEIEHAYVVDAWLARHDPSTEAMLNASGVKTPETLLGLTLQRGFTPNARFCKRILSMDEQQMEWFLDTAPVWVGDWVESAVGLDRLDQYDAYREGVQRIRRLRGSLPVSAVC